MNQEYKCCICDKVMNTYGVLYASKELKTPTENLRCVCKKCIHILVKVKA